MYHVDLKLYKRCLKAGWLSTSSNVVPASRHHRVNSRVWVSSIEQYPERHLDVDSVRYRKARITCPSARDSSSKINRRRLASGSAMSSAGSQADCLFFIDQPSIQRGQPEPAGNPTDQQLNNFPFAAVDQRILWIWWDFLPEYKRYISKEPDLSYSVLRRVTIDSRMGLILLLDRSTF